MSMLPPRAAARGAAFVGRVHRGYKTTVSPTPLSQPPEEQRIMRSAVDALVQERKENVKEERTPRDPATLFLRQGRALLESIDDGGKVTLQKETGVPGVFCIELENPERKNCMTASMMVQLEDVLREINTHPECVAVVLRGVGMQFCGGADINLAKQHLLTAERGLIMCRYMQTLLLELHNLPCISVAAIEGGAIGGGAELAIACDFRVVSDSSRVHFIHTHMGLSTGWGGGTRLTKLVGRRAALLLLCSGKPCAPQDAVSFGLADKISREGETYRDAIGFIKGNFLQAPPEAVKGCKDVIAAAEILSPRTALIYEQNVFAGLWGKNARSKALASKAETQPEKLISGATAA